MGMDCRYRLRKDAIPYRRQLLGRLRPQQVSARSDMAGLRGYHYGFRHPRALPATNRLNYLNYYWNQFDQDTVISFRSFYGKNKSRDV